MSDARPALGTPPADAVTPPARRRTMRFALLVVVPLVAALAAVVVYLAGGRYVQTDNAYVKADKVPLSAEVAGAVAEVLVRGDRFSIVRPRQTYDDLIGLDRLAAWQV